MVKQGNFHFFLLATPLSSIIPSAQVGTFCNGPKRSGSPDSFGLLVLTPYFWKQGDAFRPIGSFP